MSYCVGFHIHNTSTGYDVYFGKKRDNVDLILDTNGEYVCYTAILTINHFIHYKNALYAFRNKHKIHYSLSTWSYTRNTSDQAHGYDFDIGQGHVGILIGYFPSGSEMFVYVGERGSSIFTGR